MVGRRINSFPLEDQANICVTRLKNLRQLAEDNLSGYVSKSKRALLNGVINDVIDSLRRLQAWTKEFTKANQTQDAELLTNATTLFQTLIEAIDRAVRKLEARLRHRRLKGVGFILHQRNNLEEDLSKSLKDVSDIIGRLHNVLPLVRGISNKQEDRENRKSRVFQQASRTYDVFARGFEEMDREETEHVQTRALQMLWVHIPRLPDLEEKAGNPEDQGDGLYYDQDQITKARSALDDFYNAWHDSPTMTSCTPPPAIKNVACICLILAGMQQEFLLQDFINSGKTDANLRFEKEQLRMILQGKNANYADTFYTEQARVSPKHWPDGAHAEFEAEEPLPFIPLLGTVKKGGYGVVIKVKDPLSGDIYVKKQQLIPPGEKEIHDARQHLKRESDRLKRLDHRHVVQLVKSYQRGRAFGLVMKPAASGNLRMFLDRFQKNKFYAQEGELDSVWLRPHFLKAFGCLAHGLEYIHESKIRHKDIKPENILFQNATKLPENPQKPARFLWADFGLAYDFSEASDSKTISTNLYSPTYAPPEVISTWRRGQSNKERKQSVLPSVSEVIDDGKVKMKTQFDRTQTSDDEIEAHGRAADVFGLGCVFFELLGRLIDCDLPINKETPQFADNIENLRAWAVSKKTMEEAKELCSLFNVAADMIARKPGERLQIKQVVKAVMKASKAFSCDLCRREYEKRKSSKNVPDPAFAVASTAGPQGPVFALPPSPVESILKRVNSAMSISGRPARASRKMSTQSPTTPY